MNGYLKSEWLPAYFGGDKKHYDFFHPTEAGEERKDNETSILPETGQKYAVGLAIKAGVNIVFFVRCSNVTQNEMDIEIIGFKKVHHFPGEPAVKSFCKQLLEAAKNAVKEHGVRTSTKSIAANVYE